MPGNRKTRVASTLALTALQLVACGEPRTITVPVTRTANPASVHCAEQGGRHELIDEAEGQAGYCVLPDGRRVEEWIFFKASRTG